MGNIRHFRELDVYKMAMDAAVEIAEAQMIFHPEQWMIHAIREEAADYG